MQKENKRKFAETENTVLIERLVIMDERKVLKDLQLSSERDGIKDRKWEERGNDEISFKEIELADRYSGGDIVQATGSMFQGLSQRSRLVMVI